MDGLSLAAFNEVDSGLDTIITKTGARGEALDDMTGILERITTSISTFFETAGTAIGEVNTSFGVTGNQLEDLSTMFIKFAELNNTDVSNAVDITQKVMTAFGLTTDDVGGLRFTGGKGHEYQGNNLWSIGPYQHEHDNVKLSFGGVGNDIYYKSSKLRYSLWTAMTNALSDVRYKTNIKKSDVNCLDIVNNINFYSFDWAKGKDPCKKKEPFKVGMIAQEVESIDKDFVYDNDGVVKFVDTYRMLNVALKSIQELSVKVDRLECELEGKGA